uniref:Transmembrane protein n=1 Tax=Strongyloides stercoralis TaxID=6248 RepID=A0A0K0DYE4_STRER
MISSNLTDFSRIEYQEILTIPIILIQKGNQTFGELKNSIYHSKVIMKVEPINKIDKKNYPLSNNNFPTSYDIKNRSSMYNIAFSSNSPEYYPSQCCESLHASHAVYLSLILQLFFFVCIGILYYMLEQQNYVAAIAVFRPALIFFGIVNLIGIFCALIGVFREKNIFLQIQITILTGLITFADIFALFLIFIMAIGTRSKTTSLIPGKLVNVDKFEVLLGPFWIYICAISLHMCAAAMMCFNGVNKKFSIYLQDKIRYQELNHQGAENIQVLKIVPTDERV